MSCDNVRDMLEEYIMDELSKDEMRQIKNHLDSCNNCMKEFEDVNNTVLKLKTLKNSLKVKESVLNMSKKDISRKIGTKRRSKRSGFRVLPNIAACFFLVLFILAGSVIAFPAFAANYVPELPIVKELNQVRTQSSEIAKVNSELTKEISDLRNQNEQLKIEIKKIAGESIPEITTSEGIPAHENYQIQELVISFIKAQYNKDLKTIQSMCTEEYNKSIEKYSSDVLREKTGDLIFSQITNVAKEGGKYLVYIRLSDGITKDDAQYQQNIELEKVDGKFLISFVGIDA